MKHTKGFHCTEDCNEKNSAIPAVPATRLIANIVNTVFTVFPTLGMKLSKQQASRLLTLMTTSGMLGSRFSSDILPHPGERTKYVDYMVQYNDNVRSIARFVGIRPHVAVDFVRGCFNTNKSRGGMYPYTPDEKSSWRYHKHLVTKFGESIAQYITESMIGVIPSSRVTDHFFLLNRISKNLAKASNVKFFILDGCRYVADHEDQQRVKAPGQAEMIFIDEFINYIRELDEAKYTLFSDEIADLLADAPSPFMPDCSAIIEHLDMSRFDDDIAAVHICFEKLIDKPKPKPKPNPKPRSLSDAGSEPGSESKEEKSAAKNATEPSQLSQFLGGLPLALPVMINGIPVMLPQSLLAFQVLPLLPQQPLPLQPQPQHQIAPIMPPQMPSVSRPKKLRAAMDDGTSEDDDSDN